MPNGIGTYVAPQPVAQAPTPVAPPAGAPSPDLGNKWLQYFKAPAIQAGLFQMGASLLANTGNNSSFPQRLGVALGDAGQAAGRTTKFVLDQKNKQAELGQGQQRIQQGNEQLAETKRGNLANEDFAGKRLSQDQSQFETTTAATARNNADELAFKKLNLANTSSFQNATLALQREQLAVSQAGMQTPRGRAIIQLLKSAADQAGLDSTFDQDAYIDHGMQAIDKIFPGASDVPEVSGGATPAPAVPGTPTTPAAPSAAVPPTPAVPPVGGLAIGTTATNPKTKEKVQWDGSTWKPVK